MRVDSTLAFDLLKNSRRKESMAYSIKSDQSFFVDLDTSIILRAFAIISIVSVYLFLLAGFNFVLFTVPKLAAGDLEGPTVAFMQPYGRYLRKLLVPTVLYLLAAMVIFQQFPVFSLLFLGNFQGPEYGNGLTYWFLDVLLQMLIMFGLILAIKPARRYLFANPYNFFLGTFAVSFTVRAVSQALFDASSLTNRLPHLFFPVFLLGGLLAYSESRGQKLASSLALVVGTAPFFLEGSRLAPLVLVGGFAILWIATIKVPKVLADGLMKVALSSLFIYLCHFQARAVLEKLVDDPHPLFSTVIAVLAGIALAAGWKNRKLFQTLVFQSLRLGPVGALRAAQNGMKRA